MIAEHIAQKMQGGSMIRKMFEEGTRLRTLYGAENVYDFSIGNPDAEPPRAVLDALRKLVDAPDIHKYMANAGHEDVRAAIARKEGARAGLTLTANHVVMTVGAAGGLNATLKALLNPGEEVIVIAPYFVEYFSYIENHGGSAVVVKADPVTFLPDADAVAAAVTSRTKAIILNSPHNPTGVVYDRGTLEALAAALVRKEAEIGHAVYVLSDEPYTQLLYEGEAVPLLSVFRNGIVVNSFSKSLSLPGERIGYVAVNPACEDCENLMAALAYTNRTLGYVNAPSLFQKVVAAALDASIDVQEYRIRRDMLYNCITGLGMECVCPAGAFYLFPKVPGGDDKAFAEKAAEQHILVVPGSGFGWPGHVRLAYCVGRDVIERSFPAWERLLKG